MSVRFFRGVLSAEKIVVIQAEVLSVKRIESGAEPVTSEMAEEANAQSEYDYMLLGDYRQADVTQITDRLFSVYSCLGGRDITYEYYIFTDDLEIDHRVGVYYSDYCECVYYYGDEVLGLHKNFPRRWELR